MGVRDNAKYTTYAVAGVVFMVLYQLRDIQTTVTSIQSQVDVLGSTVDEVSLRQAQQALKLGRTDLGAANPGRPIRTPRPQQVAMGPPMGKAAVTVAAPVPDSPAEVGRPDDGSTPVVVEASPLSPKQQPPQKKKPPPPPPPPKGDFVWPVVLPEWSLVPNDEADTSPLPGEGLLSEAALALPRVGNGVLFNAIHRNADAKRPSKPIMQAIKGAQRMRQAMEDRRATGDIPDSLGFVLFTEKEPHKFMGNEVLCRAHLWPECAEFQEAIKVFDLVLFYDDLAMPPILERRERFQTWPELWLKRIFASLNSPFAQTMVVDSDVYGCTVFEDLFTQYLGPEHDVAATLAPAPFGASRNYKGAFRPGFPQKYEEFTERNLGLHLLKTGKKEVLEMLALFRDVYIRQANDTEHVSIGNDQCAFRESLFTMIEAGKVTESLIPPQHGCRHETGCADGCYAVHRHSNPEMSKAELKVEKARQREEKKAKKAAEAARVAAAVAGDIAAAEAPAGEQAAPAGEEAAAEGV